VVDNSAHDGGLKQNERFDYEEEWLYCSATVQVHYLKHHKKHFLGHNVQVHVQVNNQKKHPVLSFS
jgi:hypothetical protein